MARPKREPTDAERVLMSEIELHTLLVYDSMLRHLRDRCKTLEIRDLRVLIDYLGMRFATLGAATVARSRGCSIDNVHEICESIRERISELADNMVQN